MGFIWEFRSEFLLLCFFWALGWGFGFGALDGVCTVGFGWGFGFSVLDRVCRDSTGLGGFYGSVGFWGY